MKPRAIRILGASGHRENILVLPLSAINGIHAQRVLDGGHTYALTYPCGASQITIDLSKAEYEWVMEHCYDVLDLPASQAAGTYTDRAVSEPLPRVEQP